MVRIFYALFALLTFASCANTYNIQGSSNVPTLDGAKLFLKTFVDTDFKNIDSCDIVHGEFNFCGPLDSTKIAILFMDDEGIMPVVLESGEILINIDNTQQKVSGTPLNEKLTEFIEKYKIRLRITKQIHFVFHGFGKHPTKRIPHQFEIRCVNISRTRLLRPTTVTRSSHLGWKTS